MSSRSCVLLVQLLKKLCHCSDVVFFAQESVVRTVEQENRYYTNTLFLLVSLTDL